MLVRRTLALLAAALTAASLTAGVAATSQPALAQAPAAAPTAGSYLAVSPTRILDTRSSLPRGVAARSAVGVQVTGRAGIPATGVATVVLNVTVTQAKTSGFLSVYGAGTPRPTVSSLNFGAGQTVPNLVFAPVGAGGQVEFYNGAGGSLQVLADVSGYFLAGSAVNAGGYVATTPTRVLDTRSGLGVHRSPVPGLGTETVHIAGRAGVPASGVSAVVLNLTAARPVASGYIGVIRPGAVRPDVSSLNFGAGQTVPNLVVAPVAADGTVRLFNGSGRPTNLVADISGYFLSGDTRGAGAFVSTPGIRLLDTRATPTRRARTIKPGQTYKANFSSASLGGTDFLPNAVTPGVVAGLMLNVTVANPAAHGYVSVYAEGTKRPTVSSLNFVKGQTVANAVVSPWGTGTIDFYNGSGGNVDIIVDDYGYFRANAVAASLPPPLQSVGAGTVTANSAFIRWVAARPVTGDVTSVVIRRSIGRVAPQSATDGTLVATLDPTTTSFTDTGLAHAQAYSYTVFYVNYSGIYSSLSHASVSITTQLPWSGPQPVDTTGGEFSALSCVSTTFCMAVDDFGQAFSYNGTSWSGPVAVDSDTLTSVSCTTSTFCVAVDDAGSATVFDGSTWDGPTAIDPTSEFTGVSCVAPGWCVAVDDAGSAFTYSAGTWSAATVVGTGLNLQAVSCRSVGTCLAAADHVRVVSMENGTWSTPTQLSTAPYTGSASVSCPDASLCVAVLGGVSFSQVGGTWSSSSGRLSAVSCATADFCVRVGGSGAGLAAFLIPTGTVPLWSSQTTLGTKDAVAVSCPVAPFCMALSSDGYAVSSY